MNVAVVPFEMSSPGDGSGLRRALGRLALRDVAQMAVVAKIEGTATLNDVSRELASGRIAAELERAGGPGLVARSLEILSVGCEGVITPGGWLIASLKAKSGRSAGAPVGLALGHARSGAIPMRDRATLRHIRVAAQAVRAAMREAGLDRKSVELVLIKSPILLPGATGPLGPHQRRHVGSTGASRGAAALGAALALGEVRISDVADSSLCADWALHSSRTMAFSGTETDCCEVLVLGHRAGGDPRLRIERAVQSDMLDAPALEALSKAKGDLKAVFYKAGIARDGRIRGERTTVMTSELPPDKQLRAAASGVVGVTFGTGRAFISGGAEHQGAPGGCLAAVIRAVNRGPRR